jgi:hypothetical protein
MNTLRSAPFFAWALAISLIAIDVHGAGRGAEESAITSHIPRETVRSTALATIGYSKRRHILEIQFVNGAVYRYLQVPPSVYRHLISAESKARYYDSNIRRLYRSVRVRSRVKDESPN